MPAERLGLLALIRADIEATTHQNYRYYSDAYYWARALLKVLISANVRVVLVYRIANRIAQRPRLLWLAMILRSYGIRTSGAELNPMATIGPGLYLTHAVGVGVGGNVTIGANCRLHLGSVIGPVPTVTDETKVTVLGDNVFVGTHAVILGGVTVGDGAVIGANALVVRDVPAHAVISASPGKMVGSTRPVEDAPADAADTRSEAPADR